MKKDSKIVVKNNHLHHANKVGYFQFMGGPNHDVVVCCESPSCIKDGVSQVLFCIGEDDFEKCEQLIFNLK